jgi:hypothetical protein
VPAETRGTSPAFRTCRFRRWRSFRFPDRPVPLRAFPQELPVRILPVPTDMLASKIFCCLYFAVYITYQLITYHRSLPGALLQG